MAFNIQEFVSNLSVGDIAKVANFNVTITRKNNAYSSETQNMTFRTVSCSTPGRRLATAEILDYGIMKYFGHAQELDDFQMRILLSQDLREKIYFEYWLDEICGDHTSAAVTNSMYDYGYYDDYAKSTIIEVDQYNSLGVQTHYHKMLEAFPYSISALSNDWSEDAPLYLDIYFKYRHYTSSIMNGTPVSA